MPLFGAAEGTGAGFHTLFPTFAALAACDLPSPRGRGGNRCQVGRDHSGAPVPLPCSGRHPRAQRAAPCPALLQYQGHGPPHALPTRASRWARLSRSPDSVRHPARDVRCRSQWRPLFNWEREGSLRIQEAGPVLALTSRHRSQ